MREVLEGGKGNSKNEIGDDKVEEGGGEEEDGFELFKKWGGTTFGRQNFTPLIQYAYKNLTNI